MSLSLSLANLLKRDEGSVKSNATFDFYFDISMFSEISRRVKVHTFF